MAERKKKTHKVKTKPKGRCSKIGHHFFDYSNPHGNVVFNFTSQPIKDLSVFALAYPKAGHSLTQALA